MNRRFRALGLCLLALCGLTAVMAASAQAVWLEEGKEVTENKNVVAKNHTTTGKLVVSSLNFEIRCTTLESEGIKILGKGTDAEGKAKFSGCKGFQISDGKEQAKCEPLTTGGAKGVVQAGGQALLVRYATVSDKPETLRTYILFENIDLAVKPPLSLPFTTVVLPETCALAETSEITGTLVAECGLLKESKFVGEDCLEPQVTHLLQAAPVITFYKEDPKTGKDTVDVLDRLLFGENEAKLQGIAAVELASGKSWAGHV